mmetsp:Transcript_75308/g.137541  ORF Transcript_75308/g.137541 Transcript_75308/m.137541 type:complete len:733 (-) Transcript_75308:157-2355(-)
MARPSVAEAVKEAMKNNAAASEPSTTAVLYSRVRSLCCAARVPKAQRSQVPKPTEEHHGDPRPTEAPVSFDLQEVQAPQAAVVSTASPDVQLPAAVVRADGLQEAQLPAASTTSHVADRAREAASGDVSIGAATANAGTTNGSRTSARGLERAQRVRGWLEANDLLDADESDRHVGLVYDEATLLHCGPESHPEQPARVKEILTQLRLSGLAEACELLPAREAEEEELCQVHAADFVERVLHFETTARKKAKAYTFPFGPDTYVCEQTPRAARLAAGCPLNLVDAAFDESSPVTCGMAVIRPPGHHATADRASGFCLFNNVAVAARHAQHAHKVKRVAIIDWDVHHGNGTNDIFAEDPDVLFFSMHRFDAHGFFPGSGCLEDSGKADAKGYTVNVPLDKGFGDLDVQHVMRYVVCPLMDKFQPEAIFVSAGFDAAKTDPLGECRVTPEGFGWMTRCLHRLASHYCEGRLFLLLEGGYNPDMIAQCTVECVHNLVAETAGLSSGNMLFSAGLAPSPSATPLNSVPGTPVSLTPMASPLLGHTATPPATPPSLTPGASPQMGPARTPPASPHGRQKERAPASKTVYAVRKLTELHNILPLELPLAPKQNAGAGATNKNSRKNERRRQQRVADEDGQSSDSSGWAIAMGGLSDTDLPSAMSSPKSGPIRAAHPPSFQLPPAFPSLGKEEDSRAGSEPGEAEFDLDGFTEEPSSPSGSKTPPGKASTGGKKKGKKR